jgi:hypothetical protein
MPKANTRPLGLAGMGDLSAMPSSLGDAWQDCDKARVTDQGELRSWPGYNRMGMKLYNPALHGASSNRLVLIAASERYVHKRSGHLLAVVDAAGGTQGRVLAVAHHEAGVQGTAMVGRPVQTTGTGLSDLSTQGVYTGTASAIVKIQIDGAGNPDTFKWSLDNGATWGGEPVEITGAWQALALGIQVLFTAVTGHVAADAWTFKIGRAHV